MSRGKRRIGFDLEFKLVFTGVEGSRQEGIECAFQISEFCDDGSDPESKLFVTKDSDGSKGTKFKKEVSDQNVVS